MQTNGKTVLVCPGMGPLDRATILRHLLITPIGRSLLQEAIAILGQNPCDQWHVDDTNYSPAAQTCFFLSTLALARQVHAEMDGEPVLLAGPSFGIRATTVVSGSLSLEHGLKLTTGMSSVMDEWFVTSQSDLVTQSFARLAEGPREKLLDRLQSSGHYAEVSCVVDHDLVLITVDGVAHDELVIRGREAGALPLYTMKPPMHASCLSGLRNEIAQQVLSELEFCDPLVAVVSDIDGSLATSGEAIRDMVLRGIDHMVNWLVVCDTLERESVDRLWVAGQDGLFTRVPATTRRWPVHQISAAQTIAPLVRPFPG